MSKPARILNFKCRHCGNMVKVFLQKVSACSHIQPYQGICDCGQVMKYATGQKELVDDYMNSTAVVWSHHH